MSGFFEVANWSNFQHYKDRDPPWIKLHYSLISGETWVMLDDASRVLAIACMLIASRNGGKVPNKPEYIKRVSYLNGLPDFKPLIDCGFLVDASNILADASTIQANDRPEKRRGETEHIDKTEERQSAIASLPDWIDEELWNDFLLVRKTLKAVNSPKAIKSLLTKLTEWRSNGHDPNEIIRASRDNSWKGLFPPKNKPGSSSGYRLGDAVSQALNDPIGRAVANEGYDPDNF